MLREAEVENADLLIAVTNTDEVNIVACLAAKSQGVPRIVARIHNPDYHDPKKPFSKDILGMDFVIRTEQMVADEISSVLLVPGAVNVETFADGTIEVVGAVVTDASPVRDAMILGGGRIGLLLGPMDAFFESMAGFTTTGASVVATPEDVAPSLLLWRSLSQWTGGIGIVLLFVTVAPLVGFGATQLYSAEAADPVPERLTSRIRDTATILATVYCSLTLGGVIVLSLAGMGVFDAVNHAMTTVSTGGFSTRSDSIAAFDSPAIELFVAIGMLLSGANFALYFQAARGKLGRALGNVELIVYLALILGGTLITAAVLYHGGTGFPLALRDGMFQTVSLSTGTGFVTDDWKAWGSLSQGMLLMLMGIGACAGSTGGGIKVVRFVLLVRHAWQEIFRLLHPQAVTLLKFGERVIPERLRTAFLSFFFLYVAALVTGTLLMTLHGLPLGQAFGSVFACLSISGTALGPVGDASFFAELPGSAKLILTLYMLLGRLELFTVLVLLTPEFWRR